MLRFNLSKRRCVSPTTGYSNQRLDTQQKHILRNASTDLLYDISSQHKNVDQHVPKKDDRYRRDEKKEDRYKRDDKTDERNIDRSKDRSKDRRMRTRGDKRPSRKNDRKVLMAEESTKSWADTDSDSSSSSSSSSDSEQEEDRYKRDDKTDERNIDRSKDRSKDRRMRTRGDKRPSRKNDRKVLMAEESTKSWADTDSDSSSSSSSSSDSEQEEVHCLMANQTSDDEAYSKFSHQSEMASSLFINTLHVCFESVLAMDNVGMAAMFESLVATGLKGFLGCPAVIHEAALLEFFANGSVRDGLVVSTVNEVSVEISEQLLAETFELPVEGLTDLLEIPKDLVFDAKSIVSFSGEPVSISGKKKEMKIEFCLLCDIMAKTISVKAGSFDAITQEKFLMIAGITCGVKVNWNMILFNILKDMVTPGSRQAKGYAIQISLLLENVPNLELGEYSEFPSSKILTEKTVHRYISLNDKVGGEEVVDVPRVKKTPVKRAASKKMLE
ncbi:hypothetical protein F511_20587 [Dorcoceras hygrometricum]|uniref:Uncharacterized protein n=1 Tax=Dorcoceras hygrometricum TaxID=472368 RepID=A0A2Z7CZA2_9LAMI|nr:hypothetical protein F511_20587 [Dorcoceras hygrometricum]